MMQTHSKSIFNLFTLVALLLSLTGSALTSTPARAAGNILLAKPTATGSGDCSSWANACSLQTALSLSLQDTEIWVQAGTHKPDTADRTVSFVLQNGVAIYGGFDGTETLRSQRKPAIHVTILSGDLNGDDGPGFTNNGENSFHVVRAIDINNSAILDGFRIRGGNANTATPPHNSGGGMLNNSSSPTLTNLIFAGNFAAEIDGQGGGMHNDSSSPTLTNVIFSGNFAYIGGGMSGFDNSNPTLTNVTFSGNSASFHGGGMANARNSPTLTNVTFSGNSAQGGGGMFNSGADPSGPGPTLINVTFSGNSAQTGGGMSNSNSSPTLINVTFSGNSATQGGGGLFNFNSSGNNSKPTLVNTIIANSPGGGDCVNNSVILNPTSTNNLIEDASTSCGLTNGANGNIIGADPKLGPLANNGGPTRTHALLSGSPAINAGTDTNCPAKDQRGVPRPRGSHCDIGAFEARTFTISGNAGAPGVKLSYTDGTPRTVISQPNGIYSLIVSENWSGTVIPSLACYRFSPPKLEYTNVTANQTGQNYIRSFNPASPCAEVILKIKGTPRGTYVIPKNGGERPTFAGVNNGPVLVNSTGKNDVRFIVSARVSIPRTTEPPFFAELMGLPQNLLSTKYAFPYYDSDHFHTQLRLVNVSTASTTVTVRIRNQPLSGCTPRNGPYTLAAGASVLVSCAGWSAGPLVVQSSPGKIITSLRVLPKTGGPSFSEVMGVPASQLADRYAFPWYDNKARDTQLRVGNIGNGPSAVRLFIGSTEMTNCTPIPTIPYPYNLQPGTSVRVKCAGVNRGPLKVVGTAGVPIVAALRIIPLGSTEDPIRFSEVMGLPATQWTNRHAFPWYDNKNRDTQLRVGNIGTAATQVRLVIGGVEMSNCTSVPSTPYPYDLPPNTSLFVSCLGVNKGPVKVIGSSNAPIVASLRILPRNALPGTVFAEFVGLPLNRLFTGYVLPRYDNVDFSTQLRIAVP